jgi:hypothetical protein
MKFLSALSVAQSVTGHGDSFVAYFIDSNDPLAAGNTSNVMEVRTSHGLIRSINDTASGLFPSGAADKYIGVI